MSRIILAIFALSLSGILQFSAADEERELLPESDLDSTAHGAAFSADSMHFRQPMPLHKDWKPVEFYFKHCTQMDGKAHYSKTSYSCTDPF